MTSRENDLLRDEREWRTGYTVNARISARGAYLIFLGPDYMSRAGPVSRAGFSLPGSRHVC